MPSGVAHSLTELRQTAEQLSTRVARLLRDEVSSLELRRTCAEALCAGLPHLSASYLRTSIWRAAGLRLGARARIMGPLHLSGRCHWQDLLSFGDDTLVTGPLSIDLEAPVNVGARVRIGQDVMLLTVDHEIAGEQSRCGRNLALPITIGDGAWLGSRCVILPGVSVGAGAIVATGAVVTKDVAPNMLVGGVPARVLRAVDELVPVSERKLRLYSEDPDVSAA